MIKITWVKTLLSLSLVGLMVLLVACAEGGSASSGDELNQMFTAQEKASEAARSLQKVAAQATSRADATREAMILSGQQTRIAQQARETETTFAQNAQATQTARALGGTRTAESARATATTQSVQNTATAQSALATAFAHSAWATSTAQAAKFTETAFAQNMLATKTTQAQQASAAETTYAQNSQATAASASATATSQAQAAQATRVEASARETVTFAATQKQVEKENWERVTEWAWAIFKIVAMIAVAGLCCLAFFRGIQIWVLRRQEFRDAGNELVIFDVDSQGRKTAIRPGRMPGAVLQITPPGKDPLKIESGVADPETTKRDQAVSLMRAANAGQGNAAAEALEEITASPRVQRIMEPPADLMLPGVREKIDAEWKVLNAGS